MMITDNFLVFIGNKLCLHFFICSRSALWSALFGSDELVQAAHKLSQYTPKQFVLKLSNRPVCVANVQAVTCIRHQNRRGLTGISAGWPSFTASGHAAAYQWILHHDCLLLTKAPNPLFLPSLTNKAVFCLKESNWNFQKGLLLLTSPRTMSFLFE